MAEFLPWLFPVIAILIGAVIADALAASEPVVPAPVPEPAADRWVAPDAEMLAAWVRADGELASRLRVPPWINPGRDGTAWRVRDHQQRRAVELVNARRGAAADDPVYVSGPREAFRGPVVRPRCRRCRRELAECSCSGAAS